MGLDSIELIYEIEKYFSISIPDREAEKAYTVEILINCIADKLHISKFDFTLRNVTFGLLVANLSKVIENFSIPSLETKIGKTFHEFDSHKKGEVEASLGFRLPGIMPFPYPQKLTDKLKFWLNYETIYDFQKIKWKKYVDVLLAVNINENYTLKIFPSKYEVYISLMRIIVDKIGVDYFEIGLEKSFTDDLGVD